MKRISALILAAGMILSVASCSAVQGGETTGSTTSNEITETTAKEEDTPAANMENQISEDTKDERLQVLQALLNQQQTDFNASFVGKKVEVLLAKEGRHPGQLVGRSQYSHAVTVDNASGLHVGDIVEVSVKSAVSHSLIGEKI